MPRRIVFLWRARLRFTCARLALLRFLTFRLVRFDFGMAASWKAPLVAWRLDSASEKAAGRSGLPVVGAVC